MTRRAPGKIAKKADPKALADALHSAAIHLLRTLRKEDDASGLSAPRLSALSVVVFGGPITLGRLARTEQVRPPTMTRIVTGLERAGLVKRVGVADDRRLTRIEATAKGQRVLAAGRARRVALLTESVRLLGDRELAELGRGVQLFNDVLASMTARLPPGK
ncbi:MAG TPA: MarR family transcriptional regulator [Gemmatimonadaceae bacterium]|nr:MarR family transcriptional regulator [Gemmatimonadaceae bacterium]